MVFAMLFKDGSAGEQDLLNSAVSWVADSSLELTVLIPCGVAGAIVILLGSTTGVVAGGLLIDSIGSTAMVITSSF